MRKIIIMFIANLYLFNVTNAQEAVDPVKAADANRMIKSQVQNATEGAFTPFGLSNISKTFSSFSLSSFFKEGTNGKIDLQANVSKLNLIGGVSVDQKIGNSAQQASPLSLIGISPGTTIKFNIGKTWWSPKTFGTIEEQHNWESVMKSVASQNPGTDWRNISTDDVLKNGSAREKGLAMKRLRQIKGQNPITLTLEAGYTKTSFSYTMDSVALQETQVAFITPMFTLSLVKALGRISSDGYQFNGYLALSYSYSENYNAADDVSFTVPFGTTNNFYSKTLAFGQPERKTSNNIALEYRRNFFMLNKVPESSI